MTNFRFAYAHNGSDVVFTHPVLTELHIKEMRFSEGPYIGSIIIDDISRLAAPIAELEEVGRWPVDDFMVAADWHDGFGSEPKSAKIVLCRNDGETDVVSVKGKALPLYIDFADDSHMEIAVYFRL